MRNIIIILSWVPILFLWLFVRGVATFADRVGRYLPPPIADVLMWGVDIFLWLPRWWLRQVWP